jgi:hypothetical protein
MRKDCCWRSLDFTVIPFGKSNYFSTTAATAVRSTIRRLREGVEAAKK